VETACNTGMAKSTVVCAENTARIIPAAQHVYRMKGKRRNACVRMREKNSNDVDYGSEKGDEK
jgi:hypothetical protein